MKVRGRKKRKRRIDYERKDEREDEREYEREDEKENEKENERERKKEREREREREIRLHHQKITVTFLTILAVIIRKQNL
jgi:hypothetical protein